MVYLDLGVKMKSRPHLNYATLSYISSGNRTCSMKNLLTWVIMIPLIIVMSCKESPKSGDAPISSEAESVTNQIDNSLTEAEKADGWVLLFDGQNIDQWHKYNADTLNKNWVIDDNAIHFNPDNEDDGDITSNESYNDFELKIDWKVQECGNSGIMFNVQEGAEYKTPWLTGPEMQVLDNECHPDAKIRMHRAGDLYDLIECSEVTVNPGGEWNSIKIVSKDAKYEFWQNGVKVVSFEMHTPEWLAMVADSKFKDMPDFGKFKEGKIVLQDHRDRVWFKNIKIKTL